MISNKPVKLSFLQAGIWVPTATSSKQVTPFTAKLQHEQTTGIKSSKIEITKEGVSIQYLKKKNHHNNTVNISFLRKIHYINTIVILFFFKRKATKHGLLR